jgi:hypothetical protein
MNQITDEDKLAQLGDEYDQDPHVQLAQISIQLQDFLGTTLGKTLVKKATDQMDEAIREMLVRDPDEDRLKFRAYRMDALVAQQALSWINEILEDGKNAIKQLNDQDGYSQN